MDRKRKERNDKRSSLAEEKRQIGRVLLCMRKCVHIEFTRA